MPKTKSVNLLQTYGTSVDQDPEIALLEQVIIINCFKNFNTPKFIFEKKHV